MYKKKQFLYQEIYFNNFPFYDLLIAFTLNVGCGVGFNSCGMDWYKNGFDVERMTTIMLDNWIVKCEFDENEDLRLNF